MPRSISAALKSHFGQDVTTVAICWRIERRDGTVLGFTNHDRVLEIDGVTYDPLTSADLSSMEALSSTGADNLEIEIAFHSNAITKSDIVKGKYDHAQMHIFAVNYKDKSQGILKLAAGHLGEAEVREYGGKAEMVSLSDYLQNRIGRVYGYRCDVEQLGDARCGVDVGALTVSGSITAATDRFTITDSGRAEAAGYFKYGVITFTSGGNAGWTREIKAFSGGQFTLFAPFPYDVEIGDSYTAVPGCDRYPETCKTKFDNFINFRGFPHLPGRDEVVKYPDAN